MILREKTRTKRSHNPETQLDFLDRPPLPRGLGVFNPIEGCPSLGTGKEGAWEDAISEGDSERGRPERLLI